MDIISISSFLDYYERIRERTMRVVATVPPDSLDFSYHPGKFTIGDQMRHIAAIERNMYGETLQRRPSRYQGCGKDLADNYDAVCAYMAEMHAQTVAIIRTIGDEGLNEKCLTPTGSEITTWKWLRALVEHEIHHRAQLYLYLNMLEVKTPPMFGLSAEQVRELSVQSKDSEE